MLVLLRPEAETRAINGQHVRRLPNGRIYLTFEHDIVRVWQQPVDQLLTGPLATLPLAPLAGIPDADVSAVLRRIEARVRQEATPATAEQLRVGTYLLLGLRFPQDVIDDLLRGAGIMAGALKESSTYQKILREGLAEGRALGRAEGLAEGRAEEGRAILVRLGTRRFGPPDPATRAILEQLSDPERLAELAERVTEVSGWADLGLDGATR